MKRTGFWICRLFVFLWVVGHAQAELSFAPVFNDGAVLQCDMPVNIWGKADPGAIITVSFAGQVKTAVTDSFGHWALILDPMSASSESRKLTAVSSIRHEVRLSQRDGSEAAKQKSEVGNVLVGEVWLAAGQSNMVRPLSLAHSGMERLNETIPDLRFIVVPQKTGVPVERPLTSIELGWTPFSPNGNSRIAAVAFFFADEIKKKTGRPVGILQSSVGGTHAHVWTPQFALEKQPALQRYVELVRKREASGKTAAEWKKEVSDFDQYGKKLAEWNKNKTGTPPQAVPAPGFENPFWTRYPGVFYENMIAPLVPYTARGVIWYQGEANAGGAEEYRVLFPVMIEAWRKVWNRPDWPFFFVQLATFDTKDDFTGLRAAQAFTRDTVPHTGMALAIDCGEEKDIHPRAKQPVGERLARLALDQVYGQKIVSRGPALKTLEKSGGAVRVIFAFPADGLKTADGKAGVPGFEVAGDDGKFYPAQARIVSVDTVELTCVEVNHPVYVRYAWRNWIEPPVTLQNSAGLPAEPFSGRIGL